MTLSDLYTKLGFRRKASFYQRLAATYYVSARNPNTDWDQCYNLMLQSLSGHGLTLDPSDYQAGRILVKKVVFMICVFIYLLQR